MKNFQYFRPVYYDCQLKIQDFKKNSENIGISSKDYRQQVESFFLFALYFSLENTKSNFEGKSVQITKKFFENSRKLS